MAGVKETYRYITRTKGVRGGHARIENTRIGVHDIISSLQNGETVDTLSQCFPDATRAQAYECLSYYEDHHAEIDHLIAGQINLELPSRSRRARTRRRCFSGERSFCFRHAPSYLHT
ncbi:MAG TPA: DUF433 domain-containing protein [Verrucomicrobiae bacterium]|nr:DUF433 domain-containing protein [Verrucomicrobiae bacterium]